MKDIDELREALKTTIILQSNLRLRLDNLMQSKLSGRDWMQQISIINEEKNNLKKHVNMCLALMERVESSFK